MKEIAIYPNASEENWTLWSAKLLNDFKLAALAYSDEEYEENGINIFDTSGKDYILVLHARINGKNNSPSITTYKNNVGIPIGIAGVTEAYAYAELSSRNSCESKFLLYINKLDEYWKNEREAINSFSA